MEEKIDFDQIFDLKKKIMREIFDKKMMNYYVNSLKKN